MELLLEKKKQLEVLIVLVEDYMEQLVVKK